MQFQIKSWNEGTVALMIGSEQVLAYFPSVSAALLAIKAWYQCNENEPQAEVIINGNSAVVAQQMESFRQSGLL
jgi:hypothetical protein